MGFALAAISFLPQPRQFRQRHQRQGRIILMDHVLQGNESDSAATTLGGQHLGDRHDYGEDEWGTNAPSSFPPACAGASAPARASPGSRARSSPPSRIPPSPTIPPSAPTPCWRSISDRTRPTKTGGSPVLRVEHRAAAVPRADREKNRRPRYDRIFVWSWPSSSKTRNSSKVSHREELGGIRP